jgi:hypothetical protein
MEDGGIQTRGHGSAVGHSPSVQVCPRQQEESAQGVVRQAGRPQSGSPAVAVNMHAVQSTDGALLRLHVSPVSVTVTHICLPIELSYYWCYYFSVINVSVAPTERPAQHNHILPHNSSSTKIGGSQSVQKNLANSIWTQWVVH